MIGGIKGWFSALSLLGKTVAITGASAVDIGSVGAISSPPSGPQKPQLNPINKVKAANIQHRTETTTETVPFSTKDIDDPNSPSGTTTVKTDGIDGIKTNTWDVTLTNGVETSRALIKEEVTVAPIDRIVAHGTYVAPKPNCDPNYSGGCVPNVFPADVDCASGSGNGPYYAYEPVYVVGYDRYGLDRDGDGVACE